MKKIGALLLSIGLVAGMLGSVQAQSQTHVHTNVQTNEVGHKTSVTVTLNGKILPLSQSPINVNGLLLVPFRSVAEAIGADITYDAATKTVKVTKGSNTYLLPINGKTATLNGVSVPLDAPATIVKGVTFVPIRFVSENLGVEVDYDQSTQTVSLLSTDTPSLKILGPGQDEILYTDKIKVGVAAFNHELVDFRQNTQPKAAQGHVHIWLDTDVTNAKIAYKAINAEPAVFENLLPGRHTLTVQLVGNDHKPLSPEVKQVITFTSAKAPTLAISGVNEGATISGNKVTVNTSVTNFKLADFRNNPAVQAGEGHVHLWLDSDVNNPKAAFKQVNHEPVIFDHVKAGEHTLTVQLVGANHKPILPAVKQVIHFKTKSVQTSSSASTPSPKQVKTGKKYTINISNYAFKPNNLSVEAGSTVTFINADDVEHTVTAKDGSFNSGSLGKGKSFTKTFDKAGVYNIYCKPHKFMVGRIIVK